MRNNRTSHPHHPPQCLGRPRGVHAAKQPRRSARRRLDSAWPLSSAEHKSRLLVCRRCRRSCRCWAGPVLSVRLLVCCCSMPISPSRGSPSASMRLGPSGGIVRREGWVVVEVVKVEGWTSGGGQGTFSAPLPCPSVIAHLGHPSTAPSSQPSSVLERSAAESLARTLVALVRCKFALPVEFSQRHSVSDRTTNACVSGPPLFQTVAPPPKQGLRPVDSTTVADTQAPKSTRDQARVPHDLG